MVVTILLSLLFCLPEASGANFGRVKFTSFDLNGNPLTRVDGRGITTTYGYNGPDGQLDTVSYSTGGSVSMEFDFWGRVSEVWDATGGSVSTFDDLGNLKQSIRTYTGLSPFTFDYTYHADGARASLNSIAGTWTTLYDKASRYTSMTTPMGTVSSEYELNGWQKKRTLPNGAYTTFGYDPAGLPNSIVHKKPDNSLISEWSEFSYDGVFNLIDVSTSGHTFNTGFNGILGFAYTSKDQLATESSTRFGDYVESNVWDASGNPTTFRNASGRTYNNSNQRTNTGYVYDGNGNPTTHGGTTATFDEENRMLTYGSAAYTYRADGLRASDGTGSSKKYYLYDGGNAICRLDSSGNLDRTYVFAPDGLVGWSIPGSGSHQMLFDWQGNLEHSTSATGSVATSHAYNAWGQRNSVFPINAVTGANDRFGYNARWGYVRDTTGLYYCQNRYYDPANGRWLNRDPIGYDGGMNLYGYCGGGPVGAADPSGEIAFVPLFIWGSVAAIGLLGIAEAPTVDQTESDFQRNRREHYANIESFIYDSATGRCLSLLKVPGLVSTVLRASVPKEGVYRFPDKWYPGRTYTGQSGDLPERLKHWERKGRYDPNGPIHTQQVLGGRTARELAETLDIAARGGRLTDPGSTASNKRWPVSPERRRKLAGGP